MSNSPITSKTEKTIGESTKRTSETSFDIEKIDAQIKIWRERLVDLTKGNPLLGLNRSRVSKLLVTKPNPEEFFQQLVIDNSQIKVPLVKRVKKKVPQEEGLNTNFTEIEQFEYLIDQGDIEFKEEPKILFQKLRRIYNNAKSTVEERGVTTLHITFGILNWDDPNLGESISPLLMVPCQLEGRGPNLSMRLSMADEELQVNPALEIYLRERHHIELPAFEEEDPTPESLNRFLQQVREVVNEAGWSVSNEMWFSTFSFESLVIYKDLFFFRDVAIQNPIVAAFSQAREIHEQSEALGEELDELNVPDQIPIPVESADSSQLKALAISICGKHLVIHGPPGTGKSQTITNLIADALGRGKKVLFVSAKMAALNVVYKRLKKMGLERFCLEAHSTKSGKARIIEELKHTLEEPVLVNDGEQYQEHLERLKDLRKQLNEYVKELHVRREPLGKQIYQAIGQLEQLHHLPTLEFSLPWTNILEVSRDELRSKQVVLEELESNVDVFNTRMSHPWRGFSSDKPLTQDTINQLLNTLLQHFELLKSEIQQISEIIIPAEGDYSFEFLNKIRITLSDIHQADGLLNGWEGKSIQEMRELENLFKEAHSKATRCKGLRERYAKITKASIIEIRDLLEPLSTHFSSWTRIFNRQYWKWQRSVHEVFLPDADKSFGALHSYALLVKEVQEIEAWFSKEGNGLGEYVSHPIEHSDEIEKKILTIIASQSIQRAIVEGIIIVPKSSQISAKERKHIGSILQIIEDKELQETIANLTTLFPGNFANGKNIESVSASIIVERCKELKNNLNKLYEWQIFQKALARCNDEGLSPIVDALSNIGANNAVDYLTKRFLRSWIDSVLQSNDAMMNFTGKRREERIAQLKKIDRELSRLTLLNIKGTASTFSQRVTNASTEYGRSSEIGILQKELQKRRKFKPLRKLFSEIPNVLQTIKPCMLMSPISVSTFLKPGSVSFDLVVFDEASQLPTPEAIPSILRAEQVVVAGDQKQLPPTTFFQASSIFFENEDDEKYDEQLESFLDDCVAIKPVFNERELLWHYRSKDERLISFSNYYFYGNHLITFPPSTTSNEGRGVHLVYTPDGTYDRGRSRTNRVEAMRTAEIVIEQFTKYPERSIGVVAMSTAQTEAIELAIEERRSDRPDLDSYFDKDNKDEPFFVKSLENVQGDERDTIIISVGYAKTADGGLSMNFGPLNRDGGWRRLNVLVTRAKWQIVLVTSLKSHELSAINPDNRGALMLRCYIEYAEKGCKLPTEPATVTQHETNDFEDAVATALREKELVVDEQVGASGYRIDLAIRDPRDKNRYILAVECDGATYHHTKTARDRDILREEVLKSHGWKIHRIWSTDWFRNREQSVKDIMRSFMHALEHHVSESVQAADIIENPYETNPSATKNLSTSGNTNHVERKHTAGIPYLKCILTRDFDTKVLLNNSRVSILSDIVKQIIIVESPIHITLLVERLKELFGVSRAGTNIKSNVNDAVKYVCRTTGFHVKNNFIYIEDEVTDFRIPTDDVKRTLKQITDEEIRNAILHLIEDQFGFVREQLPRYVMQILGTTRDRSSSLRKIEKIVDKMLNDGIIKLQGNRLYLP